MNNITDFEITNGVLTKYKGTDPNVIIPNGVTEIGENAFYNCEFITSVTIPKGVTKIGARAFCNCKSLVSATIPNGVTSIGESAFSQCSSLTSITIPNGVISIGKHAFSHCSSLTRATIPDRVTSIGEWAFYYCSSLISVTIPNSVTSIGRGAFCDCSSLTSIEVDPQNSSYRSIDGNLYSKDGKTLIQYAIGKSEKIFAIPNSVTSIGEYAFSHCSSLTSVTIPNGVTSIGWGAFSGCYSLTSIIIPDSVTSIGECAFSDCRYLKNITIPDSVISIGEVAFFGCSSLTSIEVDPQNSSYKSTDGNLYSKDGKTLIQYAIGKSEKIFAIPNSVTSIGGSAFSYCFSLTSVTIPNSVTEIGNHAFRSCTSLTSVTIPNSVASIESWAFYGCKSLTINCEAEKKPIGWNENWNSDNRPVNWGYNPTKIASDFEIVNGVLIKYKGTAPNVIIPNSVTSIESWAFSHCSSLTSVTIPNSVTKIGAFAFDDCILLARIDVAGGNTVYKSIEGNLYSKDGETLIRYAQGKTDSKFEIPNSVKSIEYYAFAGCSSLTSVTIPNGVISIGE
ncbi:MAG: leucine-rich repeat domain-containing protein, partial [Clostridia bacterium]|nr:leucine-rich repeat domain-containing protein [Clostridia bacterium]